MSKRIFVYAHWEGLPSPMLLGILHAALGHGKEIFKFEFDAAAIRHPALANAPLDPRLGLFEGGQHPPKGMDTFGLFADSSPDRWGRLLMKRRLERQQRAGQVNKQARLHESDYLLGVHDAFRAGALRFRLDGREEFLDNQDGVAAPPLVKLRALEAASLALERDVDNTAQEGSDWINMFIAPGGSLGGARPKASVLAPDGQLLIAKFPSIGDEHDVGGWELVVHSLALACGLRVPQAAGRKFASKQHTFMVNRFDRTPAGKRLHFASAMTLTGRSDGDDAAAGATYIELAQVLMNYGARTSADLLELWSRIAFNVLVSNTDDHLRNHGFIWVPGRGWRLSQAYDMNPAPHCAGLKLNISEADNALDLDLVESVAPIFRIDAATAKATLNRFKRVVRQWRTLASKVGISAREQEEMSDAFRLSD